MTLCICSAAIHLVHQTRRANPYSNDEDAEGTSNLTRDTKDETVHVLHVARGGKPALPRSALPSARIPNHHVRRNGKYSDAAELSRLTIYRRESKHAIRRCAATARTGRDYTIVRTTARGLA